MSADGLLVVEVHPLLTAAQGDVGNARVLRHRAAARGLPVTVVTVDGDDALPAADIYLLGGAEEVEQAELARRLRAEAGLSAGASNGAAVLAVGAGFEVIGEWFDGVDGARHDGLGLLDTRTTLGTLAEAAVVTYAAPGLGLPALSGYETHRGRTDLGPGVRPLAQLEVGTGNGGRPAADGAVVGHVIGSYLHGPVLARNPELADLLLGWALGRDLAPLPSGYAEQARAQRIDEDRRDPSGWAGVRH